eukprot:264399-Prymnesium_polylepis.1
MSTPHPAPAQCSGATDSAARNSPMTRADRNRCDDRRKRGQERQSRHEAADRRRLVERFVLRLRRGVIQEGGDAGSGEQAAVQAVASARVERSAAAVQHVGAHEDIREWPAPAAQHSGDGERSAKLVRVDAELLRLVKKLRWRAANVRLVSVGAAARRAASARRRARAPFAPRRRHPRISVTRKGSARKYGT